MASFACVPANEEDQENMQGVTGGAGLLVEASDPNENVVLSKTSELLGRFAFTAPLAGEYALCFKTNTSRWFGSNLDFKFYLDINVGARAQDYEKIAKLEHLNKVDVHIRKLTDMVTEIRAEQKYLREREAAWRNLSETVHSSVIWWAVAQLVILCASGVFQMRYLKNFFRTKKLV